MYAGSGTIVLLNASMEPLATNLTLQRAARLLVKGKAVVHEAAEGRFLRDWPWPKVLVLVNYVKVAYDKLYGPQAYSRRAVLQRDNHRCAYCGQRGDTIDHVIPKSQGGATSFKNCVAACTSCNGRKRNRRPDEAGMRLLTSPYVPKRFNAYATG